MAEETSIKRVIKIFFTYVLISKSFLDIILWLFTSDYSRILELLLN